MALGDAGNYGNNNNPNRVYDSTYYSRIRIKNKEGLAVSFTFSKGLLRLEISEEKENYKYEPVIAITISPTKAKLLLSQLEPFIERMKSGEAIDPNEAVGINTGVKETTSFIAFKVTGNRTDVPEHAFVIGKINPSGVIEDAVQFTFNVDYDFSLTWTDLDNMKVDKSIDQFMGIQTIVDVLKEFAYTSAGALGASVWDTGRYETNKVSRNIDLLCDKLGVERPFKRDNGRYGDNFFTRQGNSPMNPPEPSHSEKKTYDDIEDMLS